MEIIGITGLKRSGKNSLANIIKTDRKKMWKVISLADPLRKIMEQVCVFPEDYNYEEMKEQEVLEINTINSFLRGTVKDFLGYDTDGVDELLTNASMFIDFLDQFQGRKFSPREFLQKVGTEFGRQTIGEGVWIDMLMSSLTEGNYIVPDVRFNNEAELIIDLGGRVIKTIRIGYEPEDTDGHASEQGVDDSNISVTIEAQDLSQMRRKWVMYEGDN